MVSLCLGLGILFHRHVDVVVFAQVRGVLDHGFIFVVAGDGFFHIILGHGLGRGGQFGGGGGGLFAVFGRAARCLEDWRCRTWGTGRVFCSNRKIVPRSSRRSTSCPVRL
jgi:hypothetical protein